MYLVVLQHSMDDLPVRLFEIRAEAIEYISRMTWESGEEMASLLNVDCTTPQVISLIEFKIAGVSDQGDEWSPVSREVVRDFEKEREPAAK